jgi:alkaline phosphatase D
VDVETYGDGIYAPVLLAAAETVGYDPAEVTGKISVAFINEIVAAANEGLPEDTQIPLIDAAEAGLERGIAYVDFGKINAYGMIGSRYFTAKDTFDIYAAIRYKETQGASEAMMGAEQEAWFLDTMEGSKATWKVWGNEFCLVQLAVDLSPYSLPAQFKRSFYTTTDAWDGFRNKRDELLERLVGLGGVVAITGDVHAFYAGTPGPSGDPTKKIVELVGGAVSSASFREILTSQVASDPTLRGLPGAAALALSIDTLLTSPETKINPHLAHANSNAHGYVVVEASGQELVADMRSIKATEAQTDYSGRIGDLKITSKRFRTLPGESELYADDGGAWKRWDPTTQAWV